MNHVERIYRRSSPSWNRHFRSDPGRCGESHFFRTPKRPYLGYPDFPGASGTPLYRAYLLRRIGHKGYLFLSAGIVADNYRTAIQRSCDTINKSRFPSAAVMPQTPRVCSAASRTAASCTRCGTIFPNGLSSCYVGRYTVRYAHCTMADKSWNDLPATPENCKL